MTSYSSIAAPDQDIAACPVAQGTSGFTRAEWRRLAGLYSAVGLLHICGWGAYLQCSARYPALAGLGLVAYLFGLRHAFDADHIAAVDDTVRYLQQKGERPLGIGFFFSLGHSSVVFALALATVFAAAVVKRELPGLQQIGGLLGASVSGMFLLIVGTLNLVVLLDLLEIWRTAATGKHTHLHFDQLLRQRGFLNRLLGGRLQRFMRRSWHMYPLGVLFGLGFDTASEIGLLAMTAGASTGDMPILGILALPLLFAAGMTAMDTTDGILMVRAYDWALVNPMRKMVYNVTVTTLSVCVALCVGMIELLPVIARLLGWRAPWLDVVAGTDLGMLGYVVAGALVAAWLASLLIWRLDGRVARDSLRSVRLDVGRLRRAADRFSASPRPHRSAPPARSPP